LWRLTERSDEGAPHAIRVGEAGLASELVHRQPALLRHQPGSLDAQLLDGLGGRPVGFGMKSPAELAGAEVCGVRQLFHRKCALEILAGKRQRVLDAVGPGRNFQQC